MDPLPPPSYAEVLKKDRRDRVAKRIVACCVVVVALAVGWYCHRNFGPENFGPPDQNFRWKIGPPRPKFSGKSVRLWKFGPGWGKTTTGLTTGKSIVWYKSLLAGDNCSIIIYVYSIKKFWWGIAQSAPCWCNWESGFSLALAWKYKQLGRYLHIRQHVLYLHWKFWVTLVAGPWPHTTFHFHNSLGLQHLHIQNSN